MPEATGSQVGYGNADAFAQNQEPPQILLVLAGLPGSGKSTFAHALVASAAGGRQWTRASQDDSRSKRRQEAEDTVRAALARGDNVVVDRVDFDPEYVLPLITVDFRQRAHFVRLGMEAYIRPRICCLVLAASDATLYSRLAGRADHPTLTSEEMALEVLSKMKRQWVPPAYREGFDRILTLRDNEQPPIWNAEVVQTVLDRLEKQEPARDAQQRQGARGRGGYGPRGYAPRGGGHFRGGYPRREMAWNSRPPRIVGQQQGLSVQGTRGIGQHHFWNSSQAVRGVGQSQAWNSRPPQGSGQASAWSGSQRVQRLGGGAWNLPQPGSDPGPVARP